MAPRADADVPAVPPPIDQEFVSGDWIISPHPGYCAGGGNAVRRGLCKQSTRLIQRTAAFLHVVLQKSGGASGRFAVCLNAPYHSAGSRARPFLRVPPQSYSFQLSLFYSLPFADWHVWRIHS